MTKNRVDIICLQETIKRYFTIIELKNLVDGQAFSWNWTSANGHSGGTLIGVRQGDLDAIEMSCGNFFSKVVITNRDDNFCWAVMNVYGPVQDDNK